MTDQQRENLRRGQERRRNERTHRQTITLPVDLWDTIRDAASGPKQVSAWIEAACRAQLEADRLKDLHRQLKSEDMDLDTIPR